ncbi:MAG: hypothetical protein HYZ87_02885 [Candidatus Omnitrophica bacterium]|nr:hypothetical protein [Candidatus Omnitrophota bacterium]
MKKNTLILMLVVGLSAGVAAASRPLLDLFVSVAFGRVTGLDIKLHGARLSQWTTVDFRSLEVEGFWKGGAFRSGPGRVRTLQGPHEAELRITELKVPYEIVQMFPMAAALVTSHKGTTFAVDDLKVYIKKGNPHTTYHLLYAVSKKIKIRGGVRVEGSQLKKAHFLVLCSNDVFENLPRQLRASMIHRSRDWKGLRMIFLDKELTLIGPRGPIFKAQWTLR